MIIAICGCSGVGKSTFSNYLIDVYGFNCPIHTTSRAPRKDDMNFYNYVSKEKFLNMIDNNEFFIASGDGIRYYGIEKKEMDKMHGNIVIIISLKDLPILVKKKNVTTVILKYNSISQLFENGLFRKVGFLEAIKRIFIYYSDYVKYKDYIKEVDYIIKKFKVLPNKND